MKKLTLILSIIALLGAAASAALYIKIGNTKEALTKSLTQEQAKTEGLTADLNKSKEQAANLQQQLTATDNELGDVKSKLSSSEARLVQVNRDLGNAKNEIQAKEQQRQQIQKQVDQLRQELVQARLEVAPATSDEVAGYKQTISGLETRISELQARVATPATEVTGEALAESAGTSAAASAPIPAGTTLKIAGVGPKNAFVILSLDGVRNAKAGQNIRVTRDGQEIATGQVSEIRDGNFAIAQIVASSIRSTLRAGDEATTL